MTNTNSWSAKRTRKSSEERRWKRFSGQLYLFYGSSPFRFISYTAFKRSWAEIFRRKRSSWSSQCAWFYILYLFWYAASEGFSVLFSEAVGARSSVSFSLPLSSRSGGYILQSARSSGCFRAYSGERDDCLRRTIEEHFSERGAFLQNRLFFYFLFLQTHIDKLSVKMYNYI